MGSKYEVFYWDYKIGRETIETHTNSFLNAYLTVRKLNKKWPCVGIRIRRYK